LEDGELSGKEGGEEGEEEEEVDVVKRVVEETTFEERIMWVGDILGEKLPTVSKKSANFLRSVADGQEKEYKRLPPSKKFGQKFQEFVSELGAKDGSHRAKSAKVRTPYDVGHMPSRKKVKMSFYDIAECPWPSKAPPYQQSMLGTKAYPSKSTPSMRINTERVVEWENNSRECVSIASHTDYFIAAGMKLFQTLLEKTEQDEEVPPATVWNVARMGIGMMYSAGMGVQDLTKNIMWQVGEQVVTRRDQWLEKMKYRLSNHELIKLRCSDINSPNLFDDELVEKAQKVAAEKRTEEVQEEVMHKVLSLGDSSKSYSKSKTGGRKFDKQSYKSFGHDSSEKRGSFDKKKRYQKENQDETPSFRGRGAGRGRGKGQGKGQYKKSKFQPQSFGKL
jgi:hypothetical protein